MTADPGYLQSPKEPSPMNRIFLHAPLAACLAVALAACGNSKAETRHEVAEHARESTSDLRDHLKGLRSGAKETLNAARAPTERPDSFPKDIWLPDDFEITQVMDMGSIGYSLRAISNERANDLIAAYTSHLAEAGYYVFPREQVASANQVVFDGKGLNSGTVDIFDADTHREIHIGFASD
ncbi:hypothetical protein HY30_12795 [Hyphomonas chukchiensis]|uniref:Uncharacterized protein n=2 Tax=Hyphomonas chukchiensis TaxID=1280947 RepID=A0A062UES2_9PROT|nr:hypothetical protein HY30_12795 [Hyphomonas chukchiensis]